MGDLRLISRLGIDRYGLLIDGKRLPFYLANEAVRVETEDVVSRVTATFLAEAVEIDRGMVVESDGEVQLVKAPPIEPREG
jgi:hypothetical protein